LRKFRDESKMRRWKIVAWDTQGTEIAEAAVVLPLMFTMLLGVLWVGRAYNVYATMNHAAREGARAAANSDCATCTNQVLPADQIAVNYVAPILRASRLDPKLVPTATPPNFCPCGSPTCGTPVACDSAGTSAVPSICVQYDVDIGEPAYNPRSCGTAVSFQYPFQFPLPFAPPGVPNFMMRTQAQARSEK
jgi:hypothetical protein